MLEGLLVDLVPYDETRFRELEHASENGEAGFWADVGDRQFITQTMVKARFERRAERAAERPQLGVRFGIQTKAGVPIGLFGINWVVPFSRTAMLGASIGDPDYWGGGYGTDALLLMVDYGFDWLDLRKVWLMTIGLNARVLRQMEKVGFRLEARQRSAFWAHGAWADGLTYGLLRDEWPGRLAMIEKLGLQAKA